MKADLYIQGHFFAAIDLPGDSLLALLAKGMITEATARAALFQQDLQSIEGVECSISLRFKSPITYSLSKVKQP